MVRPNTHESIPYNNARRFSITTSQRRVGHADGRAAALGSQTAADGRPAVEPTEEKREHVNGKGEWRPALLRAHWHRGSPLLAEVNTKIEAVVDRIASGDHAGAAEQFSETLALGPGTWAQLPVEVRRTFIENAPTFLDEARDPELLAFDPGWITEFSRPALLALGDQSPPTFAPVVARLAEALPRVEVVTFPGAGHIPHATHPEAYVEAIVAFTRTHPA